jgi:hypothetical protein
MTTKPVIAFHNEADVPAQSQKLPSINGNPQRVVIRRDVPKLPPWRRHLDQEFVRYTDAHTCEGQHKLEQAHEQRPSIPESGSDYFLSPIVHPCGTWARKDSC